MSIVLGAFDESCELNSLLSTVGVFEMSWWPTSMSSTVETLGGSE